MVIDVRSVSTLLVQCSCRAAGSRSPGFADNRDHAAHHEVAAAVLPDLRRPARALLVHPCDADGADADQKEGPHALQHAVASRRQRLRVRAVPAQRAPAASVACALKLTRVQVMRIAKLAR